MIKEKLIPETSLLTIFEEKIQTVSFEQMNDLDNTIKSIFSAIYQDSEHSRNIHQLIIEEISKLLAKNNVERLVPKNQINDLFITFQDSKGYMLKPHSRP